METTELIALLAGVVALVIAAIAYYRSGQPLTLSGVQESITSAQSLAAELSEVASTAVQAAEQLKQTGKITRNDEALAHAMVHIKKWFPNLDAEVVYNAAEAAYFALKLSMAAMQRDKSPTSDAERLTSWAGAQARGIPPQEL